MIRRCSGIVNGARCFMASGHKPRCDPWTPRIWCECGEYKPAFNHRRCGECGGRHAKGLRTEVPYLKGQPVRQIKNPARRKLIAELMARRRAEEL